MKNKIHEFLNKKRKWYQDAGISIASLFVVLVIYRLIGFVFTKTIYLSWGTILGVTFLYVIVLVVWRIWQLKKAHQ
ncbi:hypothetical protein [Pediococcus cellicola]|uniref:Uncharacterized protein n=1 Tax=Pediococcus cellicola TaxID=319652 RepID=A0A0R2IQ72_9LACO|nr:hypothetical protein [Pediococcus cellicola]KRN67312.1 hypothetical protein IV80_GL000850 [Pediococcus cellicola]GEL14957.1 hypothetical protein PCE01_07590 [Pediococcus cellicola]